MSLQIDKETAKRVLHRAAELASRGATSLEWERRVRELSEACENAPKTHITFLGTALLAKAVDIRADAFAIKASAGTPGAYSARTLGHGVLVSSASALGIDLGRTGREPLNNQPYFRHARVTPEMVIHPSAREAVKLLLNILDELDRIESPQEALAALASFIAVRREYRTTYRVYEPGEIQLTPAAFAAAIDAFVRSDSEGGRRAQAVAAGVLDACVGPERVVLNRVNAPDKHCPGDVGIRSLRTKDGWERVFEVRDKPVTESDVSLFVEKVAEAGVGRAAVLAVHSRQQSLPDTLIEDAASTNGVLLDIFTAWHRFVVDSFFWAPEGDEFPVAVAHQRVHERLQYIEASPAAVEEWLEISAS